jgi:hypothetical protein
MVSAKRLSSSILWVVALVLLAALFAVVAIKVRPILHPQPLVVAPLDRACDLTSGPCTARFPGGGVATLSVEPRGIPPIAPLHLSVELEGVDAGSVQVDFAGVDMDMGFNRPTLTGVGPGS